MKLNIHKRGLTVTAIKVNRNRPADLQTVNHNIWLEKWIFLKKNLTPILFLFQMILKIQMYEKVSLRSRRLEVVGTRKNGQARRRHARGRLHGRPPKIVSHSLSNYLEAVAWSVISLDRKRLTSHKQSVQPKSVVHFIFGLNISVIKISWVIWL